MMIIPSGKPKIWDKEPKRESVYAKDAYTGTFHRLCKTYAMQFDTDYLILSPYYGFLKPMDLVPHTYDVRFTLKGVNAETIQLTELINQWQQLQLNETRYVVLGGKKFQPLLRQIVSTTTSLDFPLDGVGGIGLMQQKLKYAIANNRPLDSHYK